MLERDGHRCTYVDDATGQRCTATEDLRACHLIPFRDFDPDDPAAYDPANVVTRCGDHDVATDRYARKRRSGTPAFAPLMPRVR